MYLYMDVQMQSNYEQTKDQTKEATDLNHL
jgi:hypothetical protein